MAGSADSASDEYRGKGLAKELAFCVIRAARDRGLETISLEVLCDNKPAVALYRKVGFEIVRKLRSFETIRGGDAKAGRFLRTEPANLIDEPEVARPCWQRESATLRNGAVSTGMNDGKGNFALFRFNTNRAQVLKIRSTDADSLNALSDAIAAEQPFQSVLVPNEPAESPLALYAEQAGWNEPFRQYEMQFKL